MKKTLNLSVSWNFQFKWTGFGNILWQILPHFLIEFIRFWSKFETWKVWKDFWNKLKQIFKKGWERPQILKQILNEFEKNLKEIWNKFEYQMRKANLLLQQFCVNLRKLKTTKIKLSNTHLIHLSAYSWQNLTFQIILNYIQLNSSEERQTKKELLVGVLQISCS